jgi:hypothetical protein
VDRCALFVDAGYVLADGAMAVHGTRHRESVSWDYAGLLQFLGSVARDRTGLPLLRCYWYEATVEGRRSPEHDALADLPGVKLRLGRMRPGRREGVESEIHRDLTTLARNGALRDALVVSAEEDLAQVIADVQDLGLRVTLVHITVDGNWTISRALRQECDDIVEIGEAHLRPFVELVVGAEPRRDDERHAVSAHPARALTNGHSPVGPLGHQQALPAGSHPAPPEIYTAPVIAEYQRTAQPAMNGQPGSPQVTNPTGPIGIAPPGPQPRQQAAPPAPAGGVQQDAVQQGNVQQGMVQQGMVQQGMVQQGGVQQGMHAAEPVPGAAQNSGPIPVAPGMQQQPPAAQQGPAVTHNAGAAPLSQHAAAAGMAGQPNPQPLAPLPAQPGRHNARAPHPGQPAAPGPVGQPGVPGQPAMQPSPAQQGHPGMAQHQAGPAGMHAGQPGPPGAPLPPGAGGPVGPGAGGPGVQGGAGGPAGPGGPATPAMPGAPPGQQPQAAVGAYPSGASTGRFTRGPQDQRAGQQFPGAPADQPIGDAGGAYVPQQGLYSGPQPAAPHPPAQQPTSVSLADAVQAAHGEGFNFGQSVARDAPALWLEAVLARKPRMPSDLEARLLQDSALPIDSLLHDEVRHALRRGFWDALERARH